MSDRKIIYVVKAKSFGVVEDGETDCAPAIQESIEVGELIGNFEKQIESLIEERNEWKAKCEIDIRIEGCVMTDRKDSPIMHYAIKPEHQGSPFEFRTLQKIRLIGYRILPLEDFKKLEDKIAAFETA